MSHFKHPVLASSGTNLEQISGKTTRKKEKNSFHHNTDNQGNNAGASELGNYVKFSAKFPGVENYNFLKKLHELKAISGNIISVLPEYTTKTVRVKTVSGDDIGTWKQEKVCSVCGCGVKPVPTKEKKRFIDYVVGKKGAHYFAGLQRCGLSWVCPECNFKINQDRVKDIDSALNEYSRRDYEIYFLTITIPHYCSEKLSDNLKTLIKGFDQVKNNGSVKRLITGKTDVIDDDGVIHTTADFFYLRSLEITYGKNGFHPHLHVIVCFPKDGGYAIPYLEKFKTEWLDYLKKNNKDREFLHKYAIRYEPYDGNKEKLSEYIAELQLKEDLQVDKLNRIISSKEKKNRRKLANELALGHKKMSHGGFTPFEILEVIRRKKAEGLTWNLEADPVSVFLEYAKAVKGKSMIQGGKYFFSNVKIEEKTDQEICKDDEVSTVLFSVQKGIWKQVAEKRLIVELKHSFETYQVFGLGCHGVELFLQENKIRFERELNVFFDG